MGGGFLDFAIVASVGRAITTMEANVAAGSNFDILSTGSLVCPPSTVVGPFDSSIHLNRCFFLQVYYFDIFHFPRIGDERFLVMGASWHVERDLVIPLFLTKVPIIFPSLSKEEKVGFELGLAKVFSSKDKVSWVTSNRDVNEIWEIYHRNLIDLHVFAP
ncbi:hypothetical protein SLEP1_g24569 [Rubroshorea leprosula]|uniref:Uncharacterized protein n=1 Tax=Rubroshorea leprosula TaxID=152421 RepID=A0AAV5JQC2_9ROSI|nr:hypothetical protein SLEP1_g24569 [Rubroshorea leprosula]